PIGIAQAAFEDLAGIFPRQAGLDFDVFRHLVVSQRDLELGADGRDVERYPRLRFDHRHQGLAELRVGNAEHGAVMHARYRMQRGLDLGRIDVDAARDHHVALAIADEDIAVGVDVTDIARGDEAVAIDLGTLFRLVVIGEVRIAGDARIDFADLALRQFFAVVADEAQFGPRGNLADGTGLLQR